MTDLARFQERLNEQIPLTCALGVEVAEYTGTQLVMKAPLALNHNHQGTGFGGSVYSVAVTAAWSLMELWLEQQSFTGSVIIQSGAIDYGQPVDRDFYAQCTLPPPEDMARFRQTIVRRGKARVCIESTVFTESLRSGVPMPAATFSGRFVVLRSP
jgi:thioesterase domain-containing protein